MLGFNKSSKKIKSKILKSYKHLDRYDYNKRCDEYYKLILNYINHEKNKKIKLLFFHPYSDIGGADNSLLRLISNIDTKKFSITFISLNKSFLKKLLDKEIEFITLKANRVITSVFELKNLITKYYKRKNYKKIIIISNQNYANIISLFATPKLNNIKTVLIERNHIDELSTYFGTQDFIKKIILKYLIKLFYPNANKIIGISKKLSYDLEKFINTKVTTIYNPAFDKKIYKYSKLKNKLKINSKYIINVSRFTKEKIIKLAYLLLRKSLKNIKI